MKVTGCFTVVTMAMEELQVSPVLGSPPNFGNHMIDFESISIHKEQAALWAPASLSVQQARDPCPNCRMPAQANAPIHPVPIERTTSPLDLHMATDRRL